MSSLRHKGTKCSPIRWGRGGVYTYGGVLLMNITCIRLDIVPHDPHPPPFSHHPRSQSVVAIRLEKSPTCTHVLQRKVWGAHLCVTPTLILPSPLSTNVWPCPHCMTGCTFTASLCHQFTYGWRVAHGSAGIVVRVSVVGACVVRGVVCTLETGIASLGLNHNEEVL